MSLLLTLALLVPLNDLGPTEYNYGFRGGLWENGANTIPSDHAAAGLRRAALVKPIGGKVVFLAIGSTNTALAFDAMREIIANDPRVNRSTLVMLNASQPDADATRWAFDWDPVYDRVRQLVLDPAGVDATQVQVVWLQLATDFPATPLPIQDGDAYRLKGSIASTLRALRTHYPNLQVAYLSSNVYAGYAMTPRNPEPYAYESALSVRMVILGQIELMRTGFLWDSRIGDVDYERGDVPWLAWGPYPWAADTPRSDGLAWTREDFTSDGETLSSRGAQKEGALLLTFLMREPTAEGWFRVATGPARRRTVGRP